MTKLRLLLRELRHANELSQEELARKLSVSRQSIISLEQGEYLPSTPVLLSMMEFFDCNIDQLFSGYEFKISQISTFSDEENNEPSHLLPGSLLELSDVQEQISTKTQNSTANLLNIYETDKEYEIKLQLPNYTEDDVNIEITNNTLTVSGSIQEQTEEEKTLIHQEWQNSEFSRSIKFTNPIHEDNTEARLENGTLIITAPKIAPKKPTTKKISVKKR